MDEKNIPVPDEEVEEDISEMTDEADISAGSDEEDAASEYNDTASAYAELEEQAAKLEAERDEWKEQYTRLYAEFDNFRKRTQKQMSETYQNASVASIEKLLPVIDSFERSLAVECADENFKNGMQMIWGQLQDYLTKMNVTAIEALGAEFDPNVHNAIQQLESADYASGQVCAVFQKGYMMGDKLIREAMVAVAVEP